MRRKEKTALSSTSVLSVYLPNNTTKPIAHHPHIHTSTLLLPPNVVSFPAPGLLILYALLFPLHTYAHFQRCHVCMCAAERKAPHMCVFFPLRLCKYCLLRCLLVHEGVGGKSQSSTEENDGVEANAGRCTVGSGGGSAGLCVRLGLWVSLLLSVHLLAEMS